MKADSGWLHISFLTHARLGVSNLRVQLLAAGGAALASQEVPNSTPDSEWTTPDMREMPPKFPPSLVG